MSELSTEIRRHASADQFVVKALDYRHEARAATLHAVVNWLVTISGDGPEDIQYRNLEVWAATAKPRDHEALCIRGFGLGGFQYLRMLFGANTTKPDVHICRFVQATIGRSVSPMEALTLLERAAEEAGVQLRDADTHIWESSARY